MRNNATDRNEQTLRLRYSRLIAGSGWLLSGAILAYVALPQQVEALQSWAPWLLMISWLLYTLQFRPAMTITPTALHIINGVRSHYFPWNAIEEVRARHSTAVVVGDRRYTCWGAPTAPSGSAVGREIARDFHARPSTALPSDERLSMPAPTDGDRSSVMDAWKKYRGTTNQDRVHSSWNWSSVIIGTAYFITAVFLTT